MKFTLEVELDNESMTSSEALAAVLEKVGKRISVQEYVERQRDSGEPSDMITRGINDSYGNPIGSWVISN